MHFTSSFICDVLCRGIVQLKMLKFKDLVDYIIQIMTKEYSSTVKVYCEDAIDTRSEPEAAFSMNVLLLLRIFIFCLWS